MGIRKKSYSIFTLLDLLSMTIGFYLGIYIRYKSLNIVHNNPVYGEVYGVLIMAVIAIAFFFRPYEDFFRRGNWLEFVNTAKCLVVQMVIAIIYMFVLQKSNEYSRLAFGFAFVMMFVLTYLGRCIAKVIFVKPMRQDCIAKSFWLLQ